jgi:hypothetical protein
MPDGPEDYVFAPPCAVASLSRKHSPCLVKHCQLLRRWWRRQCWVCMKFPSWITHTTTTVWLAMFHGLELYCVKHPKRPVRVKLLGLSCHATCSTVFRATVQPGSPGLSGRHILVSTKVLGYDVLPLAAVGGGQQICKKNSMCFVAPEEYIPAGWRGFG